MKMKKKLTISIAAYNSAKYVGEAIESILAAKTRNEIEIIVNDDGGTDETINIAKQYASLYPEIVIPVHKENGGWGSTVNYAINYAAGEYLRLLDGDDLVDAEGIDTIVEKISRIDADIFYTPLVTFNYLTKVETPVERPKIEYGKVLDIRTVDHKLTMPAMTVKIESLRNNGVHITEKCFYTDFEYNIKCIGNADTIYAVDHIVYKYRMGHEGQSVSSTGRLRHYDDQFKVLESILKYYSLSNKSKNIELISKYISLYLDHTLLAMCELGKQEDCRSIVEDIEQQYPGLYHPQRKKAILMKKTNYRIAGIIQKFDKEFLR